MSSPSPKKLSSDPFLIDSHKLQYHPKRVAQWLDAKTLDEKLQVFPIYVEISPVGHCNHRCTFCAVDYIGYKNRALEPINLCATLENMAKYGVKSVMFAGEGEPMLHPDIAELTNYAAHVGLDVSFTTNGTALTQKFVDTALQSTKWIKVSINGGKTSYGTIHQTKQSDYERVWANIERALRRRNKETLPCAIGAQVVVIPENLSDLESLVQRAAQAATDYIVIKPYSQHKSSPTKTYQGVSYREQKDIFRGLQEAYGTEKFRVIVRENAMEDWDEGTHSYNVCNATPNFWAYIMATGDVYTCSAYLLNPAFCMGSINDAPFSSIWTGVKRRQHIVAMESLDISQCRVNCRMNQVNKYLDNIKQGHPHASFI